MVGDSSGLGVYGVPQVNLILRSPLQFLGSYSVVGIGKFNLLFLWLLGGVRLVPLTCQPTDHAQAEQVTGLLGVACRCFSVHTVRNLYPSWEFPKMRGTLFWCPYDKDPTI